MSNIRSIRSVGERPPQYRSTFGIYLAVSLMIAGSACGGFAVALSRWWALAAVPLIVVGWLGLAVELGRPREPRR